MENQTTYPPQQAPGNSSGANTVLLVVIILILAGAGYWWYRSQGAPASKNPSINVEVKLPANPSNTETTTTP